MGMHGVLECWLKYFHHLIFHTEIISDFNQVAQAKPKVKASVLPGFSHRHSQVCGIIMSSRYNLFYCLGIYYPYIICNLNCYDYS